MELFNFDNPKPVSPFYSHDLRLWVVTRHEDAVRVLSNHEEFSASAIAFTDFGIRSPIDGKILDAKDSFLGSDPPLKSQLRKITTGHFSSSNVKKLIPFMNERLIEIFDGLTAVDQPCLVNDICTPFSAKILTNLFGLDPAYCGNVEFWQGVFGFAKRHLWENLQGEVDQAVREIWQAANQLETRTSLGLIPGLMKMYQQGSLEAVQCVDIVASIIAGSADTLSLLMGNLLMLLDSDGYSRQQVLEDPACFPKMLESSLVETSPVQFSFRKSTREVHIGGVVIPSASQILVHIGTANQIAIQSARNYYGDKSSTKKCSHLAFGRGAHTCPGKHLAIVQAELILKSLIIKFPDLELVSNSYRSLGEPLFCGPKTLKINLSNQ